MDEERPARRRRDDGEPDENRPARSRRDDDEPDERPPARSRRRTKTDAGPREPRQERNARMTVAQAAQRGLRQLAEITGKKPEGITDVEPAEDGWVVGVEVVEGQRIPSSSDILAIYEAELDKEGELLSYRRIRRYLRGRADSNEDR